MIQEIDQFRRKLTSWSGGAHCCFSRYIFELEPILRLLVTIHDGNTDLGHFEDLDHNRHYFYITPEIWSYWPDSFASSVSHKVVPKSNGEKFVLDLEQMRYPPSNSQQWKAALKDVDDALKDGGDTRGALGVTLWDTTPDLIYSGHSDLAWEFVREANPKALQGNDPSLEDFCSMLKDSSYWSDLEPTLRNTPVECKKAKTKPQT